MATAGDSEIELQKPRQYDALSFVPIAAGLYWLLAESGGGWLFWALLPATLLLGSGFALLMLPGNPRVTAYMAAGGLVGVVCAFFGVFAADLGTALLAGLGSAASYLAAGRAGLIREPLYKGAPPPAHSTALDAKAALDETVLAWFVGSARLPDATMVVTMAEQLERLEKIIEERGWDRDPRGFHATPPPPDKTWFDRGRIFGIDYDILRFGSGFEPEDTLPGATLWKGHVRNNTCEVRILRHEGAPRPWLLCIHGYRMGLPFMDLGLFPPQVLHRKLGYNIIQPVLPLHGSRRIGPQSGDQFLDWDLLDLVYAEAQTLWDLRRTLAWLRQQEPEARVGVLGYSLGGYNASLLAAYEKQLDFVIAGIPVTDFATALWKFMPSAHRQYCEAYGINEARYRNLLKLVSPLQLPPVVDKERLLIYGGTADRIVPPSHLIALSKHWDVPVRWYQGSHLSVRQERETRDTLREATTRANW